MSNPFESNNPGLGGINELTSSEETFIQNLAGLSYASGDILYHNGSNLTRLPKGSDGEFLSLTSGIPDWVTSPAGYDNLTEFVDQTAWRVFYSNGTGDVTELALGADGTFLKSNGATSAPTFATPAGSGDVSKVGTPVNNQIGVWTGDGTIEGTTGFTYDGSNLLLTGDIGATGTRITKGWFTDLQVTNAIAGSVTGNAATVTTNANLTGVVTSTGNATAIADAALSIAKTSGLQTALDAKAPLSSPTFTTSITGSYLTASELLITDASKNIISAAVATYPSLTELTYLKGVTSAIQTQFTNKQGLDATLTALAAYNTNGLLTQTAADTFTGRTITGTTNLIDVTNGNGVSGNPTLTVGANVGIATGDIWTGVHDFGGATSLEVPNANATVGSTTGLVAIDTTVTDFSHGILEYYSGEVMAVVSVPIAELTSPVDGDIVTYNATADEFQLTQPTAPTVAKSSVLQNITIPCNQSTVDQVIMSGSDDENSFAYARAANLLVLMTDGVMPQMRNVQTEYASSEIRSVIINGSYVYVLLTASSVCKVFRYLKSNLTTSPTEITTSGQAFSTTSTNIKMAIDGTTFYFTGKAGNNANLNVISKYTLSGTTLTYSADVTCGSTSNDFSAGVAVISGNIYGLNNVDEIITKFNSSGTETDDSDAIFSQPSLTFRDLFNWNGRLFVFQPVRPSTTSGVGASAVFYRVYVS